MRSTKFYPTRLVSSFALLLLCLLNGLNVAAQDSPNITPPASGTCMPDNADGVSTIYKYTYTGSGSTPVWSTRGQIAIVGGNTGNSVNIKSTGYGKGRLYVTFNQAGCAGSQREHIDVFKTFILPDNIVGPPCVIPTEKVTYSIRPVVSTSLTEEIGIDSYQWQLPPGWTDFQYAAGDQSSITITVPGTLTADSYTLGVKVGKCNPKLYTVEIRPAMAVPVISPVPAGCLATNATIMELKIDNFNSAYTYKWTLPSSSNWSFAPGYDGTESQVKILVDNSAYSVSVQATRPSIGTSNHPCNTVTSLPFEVKRSMAAGSRIAGPACVDGSKSNIYSIRDANNNILSGAFTWTYTPNDPNVKDASFSVTDPSGPSVSFTAGTSGGVLSVTSRGCTGAVTLPITISTARPGAITGPACVNAGSTGHVYSISAVPGATSYTWTLGPGLTSTSTLVNGGTSITVNAGNISGSSISVVANNGTCPSQPQQITVHLNAVAPNAAPPITSSKPCVNRGSADQITYTARFNTTSPAPAGQTYEWRVIYPTGVTTGWTVSGTTTNGSTITPTTGASITYVTNIANNTTGTYRVEVRAVRAGCAASAWVSTTASALTIPPFIRVNVLEMWDVSPEGDSTRLGDLLVATSIANATYRWTRSVNGSTPQLLANETGPTVNMDLLDPSGATATYFATAILNNGGCTSNTASATSQYYPISMSARVSPEQLSPEQLSSQVVVYPNPTTDGELTLKLPEFKGSAAVVLKNLQGQVVYKTQVSKTRSKLSAGKLTSGVYLLQVSLNGKVVTKKLTVKK